MSQRFVLIAVLLCVASLGGEAAAEVASDQRQVAIGYERLETLALRIADAVEADDPLRAEQVRAAIGEARAGGLTERFDKVVRLLERQRYASAKGDQAELAAQLEELLQLVMADPREARLEEQRRRLERLRREIRGALREQRSLRARAQRGGREELAERQQKLASRIERLQEDAAEADRLAGVEEPKPADPAPGAEADAPPQEGTPSIRGKLEQGGKAMRSAGDKLAEGEDPTEEQREAQRRLEEAQREAEERLRQIREEEQQRRLVKLAERFRRMHEAEVGLLKETTQRAEANAAPDDRAALIAAAQLAARQGEVGDAADRALRLVLSGDSSSVFNDVLSQTREDIRSAESRLREGRLDRQTIALEQAVVDALVDMIAAVDDSLEELDKKRSAKQQGQPGGGGGGGEDALVSKIAELRMIRSLQARLLRQTEAEQAAIEAGDSAPEESAVRLAELAGRQRKLARTAAAMSESRAP